MTVFLAGSEIETLHSFNGSVSTNANIAVSGVNRAGFACIGSQFGEARFTAQTEGWFHFRHSLVQQGVGGNTFQATARLRNATDQTIWTLITSSDTRNSHQSQISGQAAVSVVAAGPHDWDIHFKIHPTDGFVRVYASQVLVDSFEGAVQFASGDQEVSRFRFNGTFSTIPAASTQGYSQILSSSLPTLGARVYTRPLSAGSVNNWTGAVTDINDSSDTPLTLISSATNGDEILMAADDVASLREGYGITAVILGAVAQAVTGSPVNNLAGRVKLGATTYDMGAAVPLSAGFSPVRYVLTHDPATSLPWQLADFNGAEIGLQART